MKFYQCNVCGNTVEMIRESSSPMSCCGRYMQELLPGYTDADKEKHVPAIQEKGDTVTVTIGSRPHPMAWSHYISWILIETEKGVQRINLTPSDDPKATFHLAQGDHLVAAYAWCNLHGLWVATP